MNELFSIPETLSPRLAWMKQHEIRTHFQSLMVDEGVPWTAWLPIHDWDVNSSECFSDEFENDVGYGATKDEAVMDLALKCKIRLWNEPEPTEGDRIKAIGASLGWTNIHGGPEDGGLYWRGMPPGGRGLMQPCPDWLNNPAEPNSND